MPELGLGFFTPHNRSIGGIIADVTLEENERDEVTTTEHPVEQGAPIGDHAFKRQEEVTLRVGWSESKTGDLSAESGIYGILLNWQASFVLFDLYTGKRRHRNMLITSINVVTDQHTEHVLGAVLSCKEIILTQTQTVQTSVSNDSSSHADSSATAPMLHDGSRSLEPVVTTQPPDINLLGGNF